MGSGIYAIGNDGEYTPRFNPPADISAETEWWKNTSLNGIQLFADGQGNIYLRGSIYAQNGYFQGTVYARDGEFNGNIYMKGGSISWVNVNTPSASQRGTGGIVLGASSLTHIAV